MKKEIINIIIVGLGGFLGTTFRYIVGRIFIFYNLINFPFSTLSVNIIGSFILGFLMRIILNSNMIGTKLALFLTIGFCGGFTTFSTFSYDNFLLFKNGLIFQAILNILLSIILGILAVLAGYFFAKNIIT